MNRSSPSLPTVVLLADHEHRNGGGLRLLAIKLMPDITACCIFITPSRWLANGQRTNFLYHDTTTYSGRTLNLDSLVKIVIIRQCPLPRPFRLEKSIACILEMVFRFIHPLAQTFPSRGQSLKCLRHPQTGWPLVRTTVQGASTYIALQSAAC